MSFSTLRSLLFLTLALQPQLGLSDSKVQTMGDTFVRLLPPSWSATQGSWNYVDIADCYQHLPTCFGNNPSSPYGFPSFPGDDPNQVVSSFHLEPSSAVVMFLRTPPEVRYYGFTQYLMNRGSTGKMPFGSMGDTLNQLEMRMIPATGGSATPVFNQYAVLVWTGDEATLGDIKSLLSQQGIPAAAVNYLPIPVTLPVYLGSGPTADTFGMLMRTALPTDPSAFEQYKTEKPFYILKVTPDSPITRIPPKLIPYAKEGSGIIESPKLNQALDQLVKDIKRNYKNRFTFKDSPVGYVDKEGWDCINGKSQCAGDNHDALYSSDTSSPVRVSTLQDAVLVVGVNHQKTGRALYTNHTVYDTKKIAGIVSVDDRKFTTESALYHAGFSPTDSTRAALYKNLYAYLISYDCAGLSHCLSIPAPTPENPVGLVPGAPFFMSGRAYVDPKTQIDPALTALGAEQRKVRPLLSEIVQDRVFILKTR